MIKELEPCPFKNDGKAHSPKLITAMGEACVLCSCGTSGKAFSGIDAGEKAIEFWNDRYKRTCKNLHPDPDKGFICSECSALIIDNCVGESYVDNDGVRWYSTSTMHNFNRCPNCGAEVVDGD